MGRADYRQRTSTPETELILVTSPEKVVPKTDTELFPCADGEGRIGVQSTKVHWSGSVSAFLDWDRDRIRVSAFLSSSPRRYFT